MTATTHPGHLVNELEKFDKEFGDELESCSYYGYDKLQEILNTEDPKEALELFQDFIWDIGDELDACNPDAFDIIYELAQKHGLEIW